MSTLLVRAYLSRDTLVTPCTRPPVSTDSAIRDRPRDGNLTAIWRQPDGNLRQFAAFCHILPSSARTATRILFCPVHVLTKQLSQRYIPLSSRFLTFFPYATSWLYHTVHVRSLIISTPLYIIFACTHSVTLLFYICLCAWPINKSTIVFPIRLYYIFTTTVNIVYRQVGYIGK
jgi:hypothetical protein